MTKLTTHVLDIYSGKPGAGIKVELYYFNKNKREIKKTLTLNEDGRADKPLLEGEDFLNGKYELVFFIGDYFKNITKSGELSFLDDVAIRFGISNSKEHYHVPLLVSPWSYSTYRGS
ncbi:hydroxyisourate hydrolase [Candidatus Pelagibacter sp.]|nr:hydroxyisourate hydrolase [Candidatus Pelagibacter sp.]